MPHISEVWITPDGHFHLHGHNDGELVTRENTLNISNKNTDVKEIKQVVDSNKFNNKKR